MLPVPSSLPTETRHERGPKQASGRRAPSAGPMVRIPFPPAGVGSEPPPTKLGFWRSERIARPNHRAPHMGNRGIVESQTFFRLSEVSADHVFEIVEVDHDVRVEGIDIIHRDKPCRHGPFVPTCLLIGLAKIG